MTIKTGRAYENATVYINYKECSYCGSCVKVCKGQPLYLDGDRVKVDQTRLFGCIGCGHCVAVCPTGAIHVEGRDLLEKDLTDLPPLDQQADYDELKNLMLARRSCREFTEEAVPDELIEKVVAAVTSSPMGIPPSDVEITVFHGFKKVQEFAEDMIKTMNSNKWIFSKFLMLLTRPLISKESYEMATQFIRPTIEFLDLKRKAGEDWLLYNAPLAMYFHTSPYSDPTDPFIAATYAMLAAETLGLGSCMIGTIGPFFKYSSKNLKLKYGIPVKNQSGIMLIMGYPAVKYCRSITRRLANVNHVY